MKRYDDYQTDKSKISLTQEELQTIPWTKYKIVVPTEEDGKEVMDTLQHMHYGDIDTNFVTVNQLAHEYLAGTNVVVDKELYENLNRK